MWIEIFHLFNLRLEGGVIPHVGMWIEILHTVSPPVVVVSSLT